MFNIMSLYLISIAVVVVYWGAYVRTLNRSDYTRTSLLLCIAMCFYILGYTMELNSFSPAQIEFWNRAEYIGIPYVSALWLTTVLKYTGHFTRYKIVLVAAIYVIPFITMILRFTNDFHHLYFSATGFVEEYGRLVFVKESGPWLYVQAVHSMIMIFVAMGLFIHDAVESNEKQRGKITLTIAASFFAVTGLILSLTKPFSFAIDYMALFLPAACFMVVLAIACFDLLASKSVARNRAFELSSDAVLLIDRHKKILDYNSSAKQLFEPIHIWLNNGYISALFDKVPDFLNGLKKEEENVVKLRIHDEDRYYEITTRNIDDRRITRGWIKTIRDVTEIYQLNEELMTQAMTDELSELNNRRAFIQIGTGWVSQANNSGATLHLAMLDLDDFKNVNDQYGHPAGDYVIRSFSRMLKNHFGMDSLVARLGGEEFAVLKAGLSEEKMLWMLNEFLIKTRRYIFSYAGEKFHITVSVGVARKMPDQSLENMMRCADKALYQSKDRGRDCLTTVPADERITPEILSKYVG